MFTAIKKLNHLVSNFIPTTLPHSEKTKDERASLEIPREVLEEVYRSPLYQSLRQWRNTLAREKEIKPYRIFSNKVLVELARHRPKNKDDLLHIKGIGPRTVEQYGDLVLGLLVDEKG